jgi:Tol biopolymer transport system component
MSRDISRRFSGLLLAGAGLVANAEPHWERVHLPDTWELRAAIQPDINGDGRFIAFVGTYDRVTPAVTVYLYDRQTGELTTPLVDHVTEAAEPALSASGRYLAFTTIDRENRLRIDSASVTTFANRLDVHLYDLTEGRHDRLRRLNTGRAPEFSPRLSHDGEYLLYKRSSAAYRVAGDSVFGGGGYATWLDLEGWLYNVRTEERVSLGFAWGTAISDNARYVSRCASNCANSSLVPEQWIFDRQLQQAIDAPELRVIDLNEDATVILFRDESGERPELVYADLWESTSIPLPEDAPEPEIASARISADGQWRCFAGWNKGSRFDAA